MRVAWSFNNYSWPVNPEEDSGWTPEIVLSERVPIGASRSKIQIGGFKSDVRTISGWCFGPQANEQYSNLYNWMKNKTQATLTDHNGVSRTAILVEFKPAAVSAPRAWADGVQYWRYSAKWIAVD